MPSLPHLKYVSNVMETQAKIFCTRNFHQNAENLSNYILKNYLSFPHGIVHYIKKQTVIYHEF